MVSRGAHNLNVLGADVVCDAIILLRLVELSGAELHVGATFARTCRVRNRLYAAVVSRRRLQQFSCLAFSCFFFSVTLYAEFLPTKQRAKCVVLLDVGDSRSFISSWFVMVLFCCSVFGRWVRASRLPWLSS